MTNESLLLLLLLLVVSINYTQPFRIIGNLETPESGLVKEYKKGGGKEFEVAKASVEGEKSDKGFQEQQAEEKAAKGLHDKEEHKKHYDVSAGGKKGHHHDDGYFAEQHKGEEAEKGYHFEDKGSYAKGHDTKGHHNIHKLNEYQKKTEFYDEDNDEAHKENHGGFEFAKGEKSGSFDKSGHGKKAYLEGEFGKEKKYEKGHEYADDKGYKKVEGEDAYYKDGASYAKKNADEAYKKFGFEKED
ncbi:hypothetical protein NQ315_007695 [Exocentrus adspersus]|uniref:Uncharacterized protein n=1 Tax=Exocentrus adspersus TaxID=1586481 RepID=A0AAV8W8A8_9CUCU|nr:hypothetical protein NQ315_007695 [Exocentrus adspersus]